MIDIMLKTDLAIVPSSGILLEVLATGCNVIYGYYAENQKYFSDYLKNILLGGICIGDMTGDLSKLQKAIVNISNSDSFSEIRYCIGQSKNNNLKAFKQLLN